MHVLLSVKPEFARRIFEGTKKYEFRKIIFREKHIEKVVVYVSSPVKLVIGEFEIGKIIHDDINVLWRLTKADAGISREGFFEYFADKSRGYAIKIETMRKYDSPLQLNHLKISTPPQSFCYVNRPKYSISSLI
jgi:predicted transcriptional regulator